MDGMGKGMVGIEWFMRWSPPDAAYCRADWQRYLGADFGKVEPYLEKVTGRVTGSYPDAGGNIRYEVRLHGEGWLGVPMDGGEEDDGAPWPQLTSEDVQLWRLSGEGRSALVESRGRKTENRGQAGDVEVSPDYKVVRIGKRRVDLARKPKARAFLRFVRERAGESEFQVEEMREAFNAQFGEGLGHKGWNSDRLREDLFRGLARDAFDLLFDTVNLAAGIYRLRI